MKSAIEHSDSLSTLKWRTSEHVTNILKFLLALAQVC